MIGTVFLYTAVLLISYSLAYFAEKTTVRNKQYYLLFLIILILSLLSGFRRYDVGIDTPNYSKYFLYGFQTYQGIEFGYKILNDILMSIYPSYTFGLTCIALMTNSLFIMRLWSLRTVSKFRYMFVGYYSMVYFLTFSGIRQWLAISIIFYFSKYVLDDNKNVFRFVIALIIAFLFHNSAIVGLLFMIPLLLSRSTKWYFFLIKTLLVIVLPIASIILLQMVLSKYGVYFDANDNTNSSGIGLMIPVRIVLACLIFFLIYRQSNILIKTIRQPSYCVLTYIEFVALVMTGTGYFWNNIGRVGWLFYSFSPVYYGMTLSLHTSKKNALVYIKYCIMLIILYYYILTITSETSMIVPYSFFWE